MNIATNVLTFNTQLYIIYACFLSVALRCVVFIKLYNFHVSFKIHSMPIHRKYNTTFYDEAINKYTLLKVHYYIYIHIYKSKLSELFFSQKIKFYVC